ncbi:MAG TPA: DEAD/DEAH box helicase [Balneolales bacterium]|nr:DEAD/DEAH box helicase [Balneolales bacterium]
MNRFGRTWWGEQWLRALDRIDFSNRLPRGRSYANKGAVATIRIKDNLITAKVQGTRKTPYDVRIVVPPFFAEEKELFIQNIRENPLVLSRLLNRELPPELLQIGEENNIRIFPYSWQDIKLNCSCPDWAVPCKHLAAVIYMVANEIDQNPFLVFKLHDFDIIGELKKLNIQVENLEQESVFSLNDCTRAARGGSKKKEDRPPARSEVPDFSTIENLLPVIPDLFLDQTLFYSGDFKSILQKVYKRAAKSEEKSLKERKRSEQAIPDANELRFQKFSVTYSPDSPASITVSDEEDRSSSLSFEDLNTLLAQTETKHLDNYSPSFGALYRTSRYCNMLVEKGAILPRLLKCRSKDYKILWQPALLNESVRNVFEQLSGWIPDDLIRIRKTSRKSRTNTRKKTQPKLWYAKKEEALQLLCSLFLNHSIQHCFLESPPRTKPKNRTDSGILELFFNDRIVNFSGFNEKEIPNTIQLWLKRFFISGKDVTPVIAVNDLDGRFEVEARVKYDNGRLQEMEPLSGFLLTADDESKMQVLKDLNLLSDYYPDLNKVIRSHGNEKLVYQSQTFSEVLLKILPALQLFGIKALLPKSLQHLLRPQVSMQLSTRDNTKTWFSLDELIDFEWKIALGDTLVSRDEFEQLSQKTMGLVKIREQYVLMDEGEVTKVIRALEKPSAPNSFQLLQAALSGEYEDAPVQIDESLKQQIRDLLKEDETPLPGTLRAKLRPYQQRGFNWLYKNARLGLGSVLADDMGLGKTLQVIAALLKFKEEGALKGHPALVIVPTTILTNWLNEIKKFAPDLRVLVYHGTGRKLTIEDTDVVITTYGIARSDKEKMAKQHWHVVVVDEAQNIKNHEIAQTKAIKKIKSKVKIALSGTPVENRLSEYWSIFDFANPGYLGGINWFTAEYAKPIELNQDRRKLEKFRMITSPFITRRVKTDKKIISDLPDKVENNQFCNLTKEQAALYKNVTHDMMQAVEHADGMNRRGMVLKLLTTLKQICNHPAQYLKNDTSDPDLSGKTMLLLQLLDTIYENNEKVLIFSQYREMGDILARILHDHLGKKALQLHGGCSRKERDEMVHAFQNNKRYDTFILSIKAGGTGLNLTAASNVIHYDLWWNPAVEAQATDRAFRIGQQQNVMVHRMITKGTLEEKIDEMLCSKRQLADLTVSSGEKWIGELNDRDLKELVSLGEELVDENRPLRI